jgi:hypothetical protein
MGRTSPCTRMARASTRGWPGVVSRTGESTTEAWWLQGTYRASHISVRAVAMKSKLSSAPRASGMQLWYASAWGSVSDQPLSIIVSPSIWRTGELAGALMGRWSHWNVQSPGALQSSWSKGAPSSTSQHAGSAAQSASAQSRSWSASLSSPSSHSHSRGPGGGVPTSSEPHADPSQQPAPQQPASQPPASGPISMAAYHSCEGVSQQPPQPSATVSTHTPQAPPRASAPIPRLASPLIAALLPAPGTAPPPRRSPPPATGPAPPDVPARSTPPTPRAPPA